ncbi:MAG: hypothetical protein ACE14T_00270 [Syntrophales bacterium]
MKGFKCLFAAIILLASTTIPAMAGEVKTSAEPSGAPVTVQAAEDRPTFDFTACALSKYVWRGYENTRNSIVIQPSMTAGYKGFGVNLWGNLDTKPYSTSNINYSTTWTETDLTLSYTKTFGLLNAGMGYIYYGLGAVNPGGTKPPDAQEIFVTVSLNTLLNPTLTVYDEIDHYHYYYALLGISHVFELSKAVSLKLGAYAGYLKSNYADAALFNAGGGYGGYPKFNDSGQATNDKFDGLHDGLITVSLPIAAAKHMTVTPMIACSFPLTSDAGNEIKGRGKKADPADNGSSFLYGGVGFTFAF